uniref:U-box domain-containing protein n=1 Tax=Heterosigma akashiwo TaxID=2829 RepID=A0A7S3Y272_HETAK
MESFFHVGEGTIGAGNKAIPESFLCPITQTIMADPVLDEDGNSYDREAIEQWIDRNGTSPITRKPLSKKALRPNRSLLDAIDEYKNRQLKDTEYQSEAQAQPLVDTVMAEALSDQEVALELKQADNGVCSIVMRPPAGTNRTPVDIVCVIDVSGSMNSAATMKATKEADSESHGFSLLDIVKHALKTVVGALNENDRVGLVAFSSTARVALQLTRTDEAGKQAARLAVEALSAGGQTSLWDGLHSGLELLREAQGAGRAATGGGVGGVGVGMVGRARAVLLLTDGLPNVVPPRGHLPMLRRYRDQHGLPGAVHTFGFGYSLDSPLLSELAENAGGAYGFIPDASFVGTIFVNAVANLLTTFAECATLALEVALPAGRTAEQVVLGGHAVQGTSWGLSIDLGTLQYGQTKDIILDFGTSFSETVSGKLSYHIVQQQNRLVEKEFDGHFEQVFDAEDIEEVRFQLFRLCVASTLQEAVAVGGTNLNGSQALVASLLTEMTASGPSDEAFAALTADVRGEGHLAVANEPDFLRWGRHFLPSLARAHLLQRCNNFKDPGVQRYGGALFAAERDAADALFCKLPPPKPSLRASPGGGRGGGGGSKCGGNRGPLPASSSQPNVLCSDGLFSVPTTILRVPGAHDVRARAAHPDHRHGPGPPGLQPLRFPHPERDEQPGPVHPVQAVREGGLGAHHGRAADGPQPGLRLCEF